MSDRNSEMKPYASGWTRRRLLHQTALATAGASAAALLPDVVQGAEAAIKASSPNECSKVKTPLKDVEGKVAFVTGGAGGIGLGMVRAFTDAGMKVAIGYRTQAHLDDAMTYLAQAKDRVQAIRIDVTDRSSVEQTAAEAVRLFGKVHLLVNNAGIGSFGPLSKATYDDCDRQVAVNFTGVFNGVHAFLPHLLAHGEGGHIVSTSSMLGLVPLTNAALYSASKAATVALMEALRGELGDRNIGVSVYCPGPVKVDRTHPGANPDGMDPLEAGRLVLRGIRRNDLYILTHPEWGQGIRDRYDALMASMPTQGDSFGKPTVTNPLLRMESDHQRCNVGASHSKEKS